MKLFIISQNTNKGFDTYDSAVVAAIDEEDARNIHPSKHYDDAVDGRFGEPYSWSSGCWAHTTDLVAVSYIGEASPGTRRGVIIASFNAG